MPATLDRIPARLSRSAAGAARLPEWRSPLFGGSQQTNSGVLAGDPSGEGERVRTAGGGQAAGALVEPEVARTRGARREILRYLGGAMNAPAPLLASTLAAMAAAVTACGASSSSRAPSAADMERAQDLERQHAAAGREVRAPQLEDLEAYLRDVPGSGPALLAEIRTSMGTFHCQLAPDQAPLTVANFVGLATGQKPWRDPDGKAQIDRPLYPGTTFHRVIPGFMIQGGDPRGDGSGDPGYQFVNESSPDLLHLPGALSMANAGRDTNGSQFFIAEVALPDLDGGYSVFGQCAEVELVRQISAVPRDERDRPATPVVIQSISFRRGEPLLPAGGVAVPPPAAL